MTYDKDYFPRLLSIPLDIRLKDPSGNGVPDEYDPQKLTLLSRHQVAFWDETDPKVVISTGKINHLLGKNVEVKFSQNEEGIFDNSSSDYVQPSKT